MRRNSRDRFTHCFKNALDAVMRVRQLAIKLEQQIASASGNRVEFLRNKPRNIRGL